MDPPPLQTRHTFRGSKYWETGGVAFEEPQRPTCVKRRLPGLWVRGKSKNK